MRDLNDLLYFTEVVAHGGFAAAGRALRQPKSKLSRRVARLEAGLGVRLIERSSRRFRVTEIGRAYYDHARRAMAEADLADAAVAAALAEPQGEVRFACPTGLAALVAEMLPEFLARHPKIRLTIVASDTPVDLIGQRIDLALRVRTSLDTDAALTMRTLARSRRMLFASPALANRLAGVSDIAQVAALPTLSSAETPGRATWDLVDGAGRAVSIGHEPRLACGDFSLLRDAAVAGLGVALLPDHACWDALRTGALVRVFPDWRGREGIVHLVFTTSRGLPPAVRAWIDHLAERFRLAFHGG